MQRPICSMSNRVRRTGPGTVMPRPELPGAGDGNRTHASSLEGWSSTIELHPRNAAKKARFFSGYFLYPLKESKPSGRVPRPHPHLRRAFRRLRTGSQKPGFSLVTFFFPKKKVTGGEGRIRTSEGCASRFTVCPLWPLGNLSVSKPKVKGVCL